jgi:lipoic acid synthetase
MAHLPRPDRCRPTAAHPAGRKPVWLKSRATFGPEYVKVKKTLAACGLHSVCEEANCPNMRECFSAGTATFIILGNICTRGCRFCDVAGGIPSGLDRDEPRRLAESVAQLKLKQVVVTSVTRDDLPDGGASIFVEVINQLRVRDPQVKIEVLIPDFAGNNTALQAVLAAEPDVLNHNIETVPRLYRRVRPKADYARSLDILRAAADHPGTFRVKSGIMVGLGESWDEVLETMRDIQAAGCNILTIGQYLAPSERHLPVERYYPPEEFIELARLGKKMGYAHVEAGPLVRSSYKAFEQAAHAEAVDERQMPGDRHV